MTFSGFQRADGRKGIRNVVAVAYLVECAHHVAREIAYPHREQAHLIGFPGCFPNEYAQNMMERLCTHPNVGAVLLVSLGCESFNRYQLEKTISQSGRPVSTLVIQREGGTRATIDKGSGMGRTGRLKTWKALSAFRWTSAILSSPPSAAARTEPVAYRAIRPSGVPFDSLVQEGATCIFEETGELIGCEEIMADRAATPELADELRRSVHKAARYYAELGYGSFAAGNADGGLSTIEEKSMGAYAKSGSSPISGLIKPGDLPPQGGLYLMDIVPDGDVRFGFPQYF